MGHLQVAAKLNCPLFRGELIAEIFAVRKPIQKYVVKHLILSI
jgi:hypothetical protein